VERYLFSATPAGRPVNPLRCAVRAARKPGVAVLATLRTHAFDPPLEASMTSLDTYHCLTAG
jgi:hypothetical protein